jgi:Ser/Thr protein kinase RdoA (MazF antagonist)
MSDLIQTAIAHFGLAVIHIQPVAESHSSTVRILTLAGGDKVVLKIPFSQNKVLREVRMLERLRDKLPVPELYNHYLDEHGVGALLLGYLPGVPMTVRGVPMTDGITPAAAFDLGQLLARLHLNAMLAFGDEFENPPSAPPDWWGMMDEYFQLWMPFCGRVLDRELLRRAEGLYQQLRADLPPPDGPCAVHFDYRPGNVLWQDGVITGLIDFESARGSSADRDFIKMKEDLWDVYPGTQKHFLAGYQSVRSLPELARTMPYYTLHLAFGGVGWCVRRGKMDDPFMQQNLATLTQLIGAI